MKKVVNDIEMVMIWLVDGFVDLGNKFLWIFVYCKLISDVVKIYDYVMDELFEEINLYVVMYYLEIDELIKGIVLFLIWEEESFIRVIIFINVLGMGVDFKGFFSIIFFGFFYLIFDVF